LAELVLDDGDALAVLRRQDVVQQRRLAGPQKAGQHRHRHPVAHVRLHRALRLVVLILPPADQAVKETPFSGSWYHNVIPIDRTEGKLETTGRWLRGWSIQPAGSAVSVQPGDTGSDRVIPDEDGIILS